jgi:hypothetical protein
MKCGTKLAELASIRWTARMKERKGRIQSVRLIRQQVDWWNGFELVARLQAKTVCGLYENASYHN